MQQFAGSGVKDLCPYWYFDLYICPISTVAVRAFAVPAAFGVVFRIEPEVKQSIQALVRLQPDIASFAAVASGRAAPRNEFLAPKRRDTISAVAGLYLDLYAVDKHFDYLV
jgi:hypothetical protein